MICSMILVLAWSPVHDFLEEVCLLEAQICSKFVCSVVGRVGFVCPFICREPAVMCLNDQRLTD